MHTMQSQPRMHRWTGRPASPVNSTSRLSKSPHRCPGLSQCEPIAHNPFRHNFMAEGKNMVIVSVHMMPLQLITTERGSLYQTCVVLTRVLVLRRGQ